MIKTRLERLFDVLPKFYIKLININVLAMFFFHNNFSFLFLTVLIDKIWGRPQKKKNVPLLMAVPLRPNPSP